MDYEKNLKQTITPLLLHPEQLQISSEQVRAKKLFGIKASPIDVGRIIGKSGSMIRALQLIYREIGKVNDHIVWLSVDNPAGREADKEYRENGAQHPKFQVPIEDRDKALERFIGIMHVLLQPVPGASLSFREIGGHTFITASTAKPVPVDLFEAYQTYAKAFGKTNGIWLTMENDY
jgi:predicted RNA-binding protein YlqC (UPF0109 family)